VRVRRALLVIVLTGLLAPSAARAAPFTASIADAGRPFARSSQGICGCAVQYVSWYTTNYFLERTRTLSALKKRGVPKRWRRRINRGIYDYEKGGYGTTNPFTRWCRNNPRKCRAVIACIGGAATYALNAPKVISQRELAKGMAKNCAAGVVIALASP
jgi:hypothetical protein